MTFDNKYGNAIDYLTEKGNVVIRYRVMSELLEDTGGEDISKLQKEILISDRYMKLIEFLKNRKEYHGATIYAVENSLNMLVDMGVRYSSGFSEFDKVVEEIVDEVKNRQIDSDHVLRYLSHIVAISFLLRAGIYDDYLLEFVKDRIATIYGFTIQNRYDIYDNISKLKGIPKSFQNRPIIWANLYENGKFCFPLEYDIYGLAYASGKLSGDFQRKINGIIRYIMDSRFQSIADGYGVLYDQKGYWAMGWDPKPTDIDKDFKYNPILLKLDLLGRFPAAVNTEWFARAIELINRYAYTDGIYKFPSSYLTEKDSCWILGNHMGLGENRRQKDALTIEGTFRALKILKVADMTKMREF